MKSCDFVSFSAFWGPHQQRMSYKYAALKIYGLLGPSGCGKTTLLKCIVGKLGLDGGEVLVFGEPPGSGGTGVPGARVGYMPQELALFGEFNIEETLTYFRRIFGESLFIDHGNSEDLIGHSLVPCQ